MTRITALVVFASAIVGGAVMYTTFTYPWMLVVYPFVLLLGYYAGKGSVK